LQNLAGLWVDTVDAAAIVRASTHAW
jgi:hypothetical protein